VGENARNCEWRWSNRALHMCLTHRISS
jgi:hypothetical protein